RQRLARGPALVGVLLEDRRHVGYCRACVVLHVERGLVVLAIERRHWGKPYGTNPSLVLPDTLNLNYAARQPNHHHPGRGRQGLAHERSGPDVAEPKAP